MAPERIRRWLLGLLVVVTPAVAIWAAPGSVECVVRQLLGVDCPGCGLGRGLAALGRGELGTALLSYPPLAALAAAWLVGVAWLSRGQQSTGWLQLGSASGLVMGAAVIGNWLVRLL